MTRELLLSYKSPPDCPLHRVCVIDDIECDKGVVNFLSMVGSIIYSPKALLDDDERKVCKSKDSNSSAHTLSCVCVPHKSTTHGCPAVA
jgi:hypothetical protein